MLQTPSTTSAPLPAIPLAYAEPERSERSFWRRLDRIGLITTVFVIPAAWVAVLVDVESVLVSGPTLMLLGLLMVIGGSLRRQPWILGIGAAHCAICVLFVGLVNLLDWSPREAEMPFRNIGAAYVLLSVPTASVLAWVRRLESLRWKDGRRPLVPEERHHAS